jgi:hypothetical protein
VPARRHLFATILRRSATLASPRRHAVELNYESTVRRMGGGPKKDSMQPVDQLAVTTFGLRVWRDLALLAAEGLAIGVVASAMFALAVFAVVR